MTEFKSTQIWKDILPALDENGLGAIGEHECLFSTGLPDLFAATEARVALETVCGINLANEKFLKIDTLAGTDKLVVGGRAVSVADKAT